jgi:rubredoxin
MTLAKPEITKETIKCPFCKKGDINILRISEYYSETVAHAAGKAKRIPQYHPEQITVYSKCPNCGVSKKEIKEILERGSEKRISDEEKIKRIRELGLPTKIEFKVK